MSYFDSHAHLDDERFDIDRQEVIKRVKDKNMKGFVSAGYSLEGSKKAIELAKKYEFIYATAGISPNDISHNEEKVWKDIEEIERMVKEQVDNKEIQSKLVAIGEIGLDYYWEKDENMRELQKKVCIKQIEIANKYNLPIVIHVREAIIDMLEILKNNPVKRKGVFHCCPQNRELIKEALKLDFYISFAGPITFKNSKNAAEIINLVPNNRILIETDSPYLAPEPVRGSRNEPINVEYVAKKIAESKQIDIKKVIDFTNKNVEELFGIK